jgi:hypothetical protein
MIHRFWTIFDDEDISITTFLIELACKKGKTVVRKRTRCETEK